jgi:Aldo/keto reductase family
VTGRIFPWRNASSIPRYSEENFNKNLELVDVIRQLAEKKKVTPGQLTLAWILAQGDNFIPIPGTKKIKHLEENVAAVNIQLSEQENATIRKAAEKPEVTGERYPPWALGMHRLFVDEPPKKWSCEKQQLGSVTCDVPLKCRVLQQVAYIDYCLDQTSGVIANAR